MNLENTNFEENRWGTTLFKLKKKGKMSVLTTKFAENVSSVIKKIKMSLLSSKCHFCPVNVTSVH